jgi:hypothetical protein
VKIYSTLLCPGKRYETAGYALLDATYARRLSSESRWRCLAGGVASNGIDVGALKYSFLHPGMYAIRYLSQ